MTISTPITADEIERLAADIERLTRERDEARTLASHLRQHAQAHAMEARSANATIREAYQAATGATGEPGNWNGAKPITDALASAHAEADKLRKALTEIRRRTGLLMHQNTGRWNMSIEHDRRTVDVLSVNQELARDALEEGCGDER